MQTLVRDRTHEFFAGYIPGLGCGSIRVRVASANDLGNPDLATLDEALESYIGAERPGEAVDQGPVPQRLIGRLIHWTRWIMWAAGYPRFHNATHTRSTDSRGTMFHISLPCPCDSASVAIQALDFVVLAINRVLADQPPGDEAEFQQLRTAVTSGPGGMNTLRFLEAAEDAGIPWQRIQGNVYQFGWGMRGQWLDSSFTENTSFIATRLAHDKMATARVLRSAGLPAPEHMRVGSADAAVQAAERLGYPVVVKPSDLDRGQGVAADLKDAAGVREAFARARALSANVLVERFYPGADYRLQVFNGDVFWAVHRVPGGVEGDGESTIAALLEKLNADPMRGPPGSPLLKQIQLDDEARTLLSEQGLDTRAVPGKGEFIRLRRTANVATGGVPVPVLEQAHPDNLELARRVAAIMRLDLVGLDLLMPDIRRSWLEVGAVICEVNAQPQLSPQLPAFLLERLVHGQGRIPVVLVMGALTDPDWAHALAALPVPASSVVGIATPEGLEIRGARASTTAGNLYRRGQALLRDPSLGAAVLVMDRAEDISAGLPVDRFDHLLLMGPPADNGETAWAEWQKLAERFARLATGSVLVNAADGEWRKRADLLPHSRMLEVEPEDLAEILADNALEVVP